MHYDSERSASGRARATGDTGKIFSAQYDPQGWRLCGKDFVRCIGAGRYIASRADRRRGPMSTMKTSRRYSPGCSTDDA